MEFHLHPELEGIGFITCGRSTVQIQHGNVMPIVEESYVLSIEDEIPEEAFAQIKHRLCSDGSKKKIKALPGYRATSTGKTISFEK